MKILNVFRKTEPSQATTERAVIAAAAHWKEAFDNSLYALLDYEQSRERAIRSVEIAAAVADEAVAQYESRWKR